METLSVTIDVIPPPPQNTHTAARQMATESRYAFCSAILRCRQFSDTLREPNNLKWSNVLPLSARQVSGEAFIVLLNFVSYRFAYKIVQTFKRSATEFCLLTTRFWQLIKRLAA